MNNSIVLGVDIGGSHITAALVNIDTRTLVLESLSREYVNANDKSESIIAIWNRVIRKSFSACTIENKMIGIAMPGPFDYQTGISLMKGQEKFDDLYGLNIKNKLAHALEIPATNIQFMNDAECFLRGESFSGSAKNFNKALGLTLGTGLGSSVYENGVCKDADLWCSSFKDGIAEDYLSTRWFTKKYYDLTGNQIKDVKELVGLSSSQSIVKEIFAEFGKNLGLFLEGFIRNTQPEIVVIGGNIANSYDLFADELLRIISNPSLTIEVRRALLGEEAPLVGAASCWYKEESKILAA